MMRSRRMHQAQRVSGGHCGGLGHQCAGGGAKPLTGQVKGFGVEKGHSRFADAEGSVPSNGGTAIHL